MKKLWNLATENFSIKGLIMVALSLLPSVFVAFLPPKDVPTDTKSNVVLAIFEIVGRIAVIAILLFSKKNFDRKADIWLVLMCVFGLLYYVSWARYFCFGMTYELLYKPLWFVPVPLAVFPILAFAFAAIWGRSIPLAIAVFALAVGHIPQSFICYLGIK